MKHNYPKNRKSRAPMKYLTKDKDGYYSDQMPPSPHPEDSALSMEVPVPNGYKLGYWCNGLNIISKGR